jgi:hypothetical protein
VDTIATISDIARDADVSVDTVLRVLNREEMDEDVSARVAAALESHGVSAPGHPQATPSDDSAGSRERASGAQLPAVGSGGGSSPAVTGEVVDSTRPLPLADVGSGVADTRDYLLQAMLQAAGAGAARSGVTSGLRYQSLEIGPLTERMTVLDQLLERLVEDLEAARDELRRGRTERIEDLTLLVDLISTSWRTMDQRLNRIERKLDRSLQSNGDQAAMPSDEHPAPEEPN